MKKKGYRGYRRWPFYLFNRPQNNNQNENNPNVVTTSPDSNSYPIATGTVKYKIRVQNLETKYISNGFFTVGYESTNRDNIQVGLEVFDSSGNQKHQLAFMISKNEKMTIIGKKIKIDDIRVSSRFLKINGKIEEIVHDYMFTSWISFSPANVYPRGGANTTPVIDIDGIVNEFEIMSLSDKTHYKILGYDRQEDKNIFFGNFGEYFTVFIGVFSTMSFYYCKGNEKNGNLGFILSGITLLFLGFKYEVFFNFLLIGFNMVGFGFLGYLKEIINEEKSFKNRRNQLIISGFLLAVFIGLLEFFPLLVIISLNILVGISKKKSKNPFIYFLMISIFMLPDYYRMLNIFVGDFTIFELLLNIAGFLSIGGIVNFVFMRKFFRKKSKSGLMLIGGEKRTQTLGFKNNFNLI